MRVALVISRTAVLALLLTLTQFPIGAAWADEDDVSVTLSRVALKGQGKPFVEAEIHKPVAGLTLELTRSDGHPVKQTAGRLGAGAKHRFLIEQPEGTFHYTGTLIARFPKGEPQELTLDFDASVLGELKLSVNDQAVDLAAHSVTLSADRPITQLHVRVQADDGHVLAEYDEKFPDKKESKSVTSLWHPEDDAKVMLIHVRASDAATVYRDMDLYPWNFEIPHEDVLFDPGQSEVVETERPKLEAASAELAKAIARYGRFAQVQLFVAGHTDTIGDATSNKSLSEARALSIARYFRSHGAKLPIHYAGFGEGGLLVPTPDETAEARNRRAAYIVAIVAPSGVHWNRLP
jgi:outer membrane protein OmpA-like peptidoglycan-associated protein